jgi:hypothetical protein
MGFESITMRDREGVRGSKGLTVAGFMFRIQRFHIHGRMDGGISLSGEFIEKRRGHGFLPKLVMCGLWSSAGRSLLANESREVGSRNSMTPIFVSSHKPCSGSIIPPNQSSTVRPPNSLSVHS